MPICRPLSASLVPVLFVALTTACANGGHAPPDPWPLADAGDTDAGEPDAGLGDSGVVSCAEGEVYVDYGTSIRAIAPEWLDVRHLGAIVDEDFEPDGIGEGLFPEETRPWITPLRSASIHFEQFESKSQLSASMSGWGFTSATSARWENQFASYSVRYANQMYQYPPDALPRVHVHPRGRWYIARIITGASASAIYESQGFAFSASLQYAMRSGGRDGAACDASQVDAARRERDAKQSALDAALRATDGDEASRSAAVENARNALASAQTYLDYLIGCLEEQSAGSPSFGSASLSFMLETSHITRRYELRGVTASEAALSATSDEEVAAAFDYEGEASDVPILVEYRPIPQIVCTQPDERLEYPPTKDIVLELDEILIHHGTGTVNRWDLELTCERDHRVEMAETTELWDREAVRDGVNGVYRRFAFGGVPDGMSVECFVNGLRHRWPSADQEIPQVRLDLSTAGEIVGARADNRWAEYEVRGRVVHVER